MNTSRKRDNLIIAGLIALSLVPAIAGVVRLSELASNGAVTPENARFFTTPLPVVIHIIGSLLFCIVGAFQFAPGFRRRHRAWHRNVGRILIVCGIASGLSGLWMAQFYTFPTPLQGELLYLIRLAVGAAMVGSIVLSLIAIRRRDIASHRAWIMRGYALGQGAGTQVLTFLPWAVLQGEPNELSRALLMAAGWGINLIIAEWIIRRPSRMSVQRQQSLSTVR